MLLGRAINSISWRWRTAMRMRFLRVNFRNGRDLIRSYRERVPCDEARCRDGTVLRHPPGRLGLAQMILEVWYDQVYTKRFYTPRPGDTVIDAGANIGLFSILLARQCPACRVLAFEAFRENYELLKANLRSADATSVTPYHLALAGKSGTGTMVDVGARSQDHYLAVSAAGERGRGTVRTFSLADALRQAGTESISLFKCDIEGSEQALFRFATSAELGRVERFAIEYHDNKCPGTLHLLQERLRDTHELVIKPDEQGYGMLYASTLSSYS